MPAVRRPSPLALVLDLTRRLAEEFDTIPLSMVSTTVKSAVSAAQLFGNDISSSLDTIEQIAREDLNALRAAAAEQAQVSLAS